jgi:hypothetical protein
MKYPGNDEPGQPGIALGMLGLLAILTRAPRYHTCILLCVEAKEPNVRITIFVASGIPV